MEAKLAAPARMQSFFETVRQSLRATEPNFGEPRSVLTSDQLLGINQVALMRIMNMQANLGELRTECPVSYTHLDVYQRQVIHSVVQGYKNHDHLCISICIGTSIGA